MSKIKYDNNHNNNNINNNNNEKNHKNDENDIDIHLDALPISSTKSAKLKYLDLSAKEQQINLNDVKPYELSYQVANNCSNIYSFAIWITNVQYATDQISDTREKSKSKHKRDRNTSKKSSYFKHRNSVEKHYHDHGNNNENIDNELVKIPPLLEPV